MALVNSAFTVNVTPGETTAPTVHVSEYDIGRTYTVTINGQNGSAFNIPTGTIATVEGTLNGVIGFTTGATISGSTVSFTLTESMTAKSGKAWCKIKLTLNNEPIQTCAFVLAVDRAGVEAETVIGAPGFEEQIQDAVDNYLEEHPVPTVTVDPTLTISGAAADAKAVGDAVDTLNDLLEVSEIPIEVSGTEYQGFYLNESSQIKSIANTAFRVIKYPVTAGARYNVHGTQCKLPLAVYPLAGFDTVDFTGSETVACDETIIPAGETNVAKDYDIDFVAPADGYIYVWYSTTSTSNHLYVAAYVNSSGRIKDKKTLKIQLFGDSITDDVWGDHTTWATILQNYMPDYDLTIINSAVAGSAIGYRGKSSSGRYADKTYNYVCDLMVDGTLDVTADVIVILIGTNNYGGSYPRIGSLGDCGVINEDQTGSGFDVYGSAQFITNKITNDTHALLLWVTPPQRYNSFDQNQQVNSLGEPLNNLSYTLRDLCHALVDCADFNGVPCLNLASSLGWNKRNVAQFTTDGLHPNKTGDEWIAQLISSEIMRHLHN